MAKNHKKWTEEELKALSRTELRRAAVEALGVDNQTLRDLEKQDLIALVLEGQELTTTAADLMQQASELEAEADRLWGDVHRRVREVATKKHQEVSNGN